MGYKDEVSAPGARPAPTEAAVDGEAPMEATLPRDAYLSAGAWQREREEILLREWVCVGREEAVAARGRLPERRCRR
ncbi:hypothetical protein ACFYM7_30215 [Streptomyces cyaneofuscatus]|uniref:hypothetical protein n=1 Tax=Streptomyces cyaneofuscatus TaxID=66883 RepID=UPI0036AF5D54